LGRIDEAITELESGVTGISGIDQMIFHDLAGIHLFARGRPDESARWAARLLALQPDGIRGAIAMARVWLAVGDLERTERWMSVVAAEGQTSDRVNYYRVYLAIAQEDLDAASEALKSMSNTPGPMRGLSLSIESKLCIVKADYECAYSAATGLGQALDQLATGGRVMPAARAQQQLDLAVVAERTGESPQAPAQSVIDATSTMPRMAWPVDGADYMDAEAFTLLGKTELALHALEESLVEDGGFIPWDTYWVYPDKGVILSELDGAPQFEDWKRRFRERREAARKRMVEMEDSGEIPAPP
jgi:hypothetical protein